MPNEYTAILVFPLNYITYDFHIAVLKEGRGETAIMAAKQAIRYIFEKTPCLKILIQVPEFNERMMRFSKNIGASLETILIENFLKFGELHNQYIYSLRRE